MVVDGSVVSGFDKSETTSIQLQAKENYPYDMTTVIQGYLAGVDENVLKYVEKYRLDKTANDERVHLGDVTSRHNLDLSQLLGADFEGYRFTAQKSAFNHIDFRHGVKGKADSSMSHPEDVARIGYVLQNYDTVETTTDADGNVDYSKQYRDKDNQPAPLVKFKKKINGTYYAVIACPDAKWKRLWLVSAYIGNKKGDTVTQESNAFALDSTPEAGLASPNISNTNVAQNIPGVKPNSMQGGADYSQKAFLPPERMTGDALVGVDATLQNRSATDETIPPSADADTSLYTREAFGNDAQVVERALQLTAEGKKKSTATAVRFAARRTRTLSCNKNVMHYGFSS